MVKIDISGAKNFLGAGLPDYSQVADAHRTLFEGIGEGAEFTGWLDLPGRVKNTELKAILSAAERIRSNSQVLVVVGIGGSYLGARAALELLRSPNYNLLKKDTPDIFFIGNNVSAAALNETIELIGDRDFFVNVISKSGGTLEPALGFRVIKALLEKKYGTAAAKKRIIATTDANKGILHDMAVAEGWERLTVPDDVGGRFSVLSAVGLLPMAVAGIDIVTLTDCAIDEFNALNLRSPDNPAWVYAGVRQQLYRQGRTIEILACQEPAFRFFAEWWKQLFGESEGKNGIGIFPAYVEYSADLHSMGQMIQEGPRSLMETVVSFEENPSLKVPFELGDKDGLNYLAGKEFSYISDTVAKAVAAAHIKGDVPNISLKVKARDEEGFASLVCFFEMSCALSAYVSGVNPFNQPGVEAYKKNMFSMLKNNEL